MNFSSKVYAQDGSFGGFGTAVNTGSSQCEGKLCNPIGSGNLSDFVQKITTAALKIGVPIAAIFIIWAGLKFVMARGNETEITKAKGIFWWTLVGTAVLLAANLLASVLTTVIRQIGV